MGLVLTWRGEVVTSSCYGSINFWTSTNRGPAGNEIKKRKKIDLFDFPVHDFTKEENGSPYFFHRSTMQMAVSVKKR